MSEGTKPLRQFCAVTEKECPACPHTGKTFHSERTGRDQEEMLPQKTWSEEDAHAAYKQEQKRKPHELYSCVSEGSHERLGVQARPRGLLRSSAIPALTILSKVEDLATGRPGCLTQHAELTRKQRKSSSASKRSTTGSALWLAKWVPSGPGLSHKLFANMLVIGSYKHKVASCHPPQEWG